MNIIIDNIQDKIEIDDDMENLLREVVSCVFKQENFQIDSEINFLLVDNDKIRELNREYRGKDKPTDVLSFPIVGTEDGRFKPEPADYDIEQGVLMLGDVVISLEMARKQAEEFGHSFKREVAFLAAHGVLHLLGYNHEKEEEETALIEKQEAILEKLGLGL